jgi:hypothetical protein
VECDADQEFEVWKLRLEEYGIDLAELVLDKRE